MKEPIFKYYNMFNCPEIDFATLEIIGMRKFIRVGEEESNVEFEIQVRLEFNGISFPPILHGALGMSWIENILAYVKTHRAYNVAESLEKRLMSDWNIWVYDKTYDEEIHYFLTVDYENICSFIPDTDLTIEDFERIIPLTGLNINKKGELE